MEQSTEEEAAASWTSVWSVLATSARISAAHVKPLTMEMLVLGFRPLLASHEGQLDRLEGAAVRDARRAEDLVRSAVWAAAAYSTLSSPPAALAKVLSIQPHEVIYMQPETGKVKGTGAAVVAVPSFYIAVSSQDRVVRMVVRGTSQLADLVTDFCGHTAPFAGGHAHYGMLCAAQALVTREISKLSAALAVYKGYGLHLVGHSLGGGVAALAACMLRRVADLNSQLHGAEVTCTAFACPPVMTRDLASSCTGFITTVVHQDDMVSRTSVATIAELVDALDQARATAVQNGEALVSKPVLDSTQAAAGALLKSWAVSRVARGSMARAALGAGLALAGTALATTVASSTSTTQVASDGAAAGARSAPAPQPGQPAQQPASAAPATTLTATQLWAVAQAAQRSLGTAVSSLSQRVKSEAELLKQEASVVVAPGSSVAAIMASVSQAVSSGNLEARGASATSTGSVPPTPAPATTPTPTGSAFGSAAAAAGAPAPPAAGQPAPDKTQASASFTWASSFLSPSNVQAARLLGGALLNKLEQSLPSSTTTGTAQPQTTGQPPGSDSAGAARDGAPTAQPDPALPAMDESISAEDDQRLHRLFCPGTLLHLRSADDGGSTLLTLVESRSTPEDRWQRLLLKRTMLSDHFMSAYLDALKRLHKQALEES